MLIVRRVLGRKQPNTDSDGEWISHAMKAAKITAEAAKMVPVAGPFIEGGANIFCVILEPLQQMKDNKEDFRELIQVLTIFLETLQQAVSAVPQSQPSEDFQRICSDFKSLMDGLLKDHTQFVATSQSKPIKQYLHSGQIKGMVSKYQKDANALKEKLTAYCLVSTHLQVQLLVGGVASTGASPGRAVDEDVSVFEDFHEFKRGDIRFQGEIKHNRIRSSHRAVPAHPFKEHHASALVYGTPHRTTVRVFEGEESNEHLKALLRYLAPLRHDNIVQIMGFCKSQFMPAVIFYEDLRPVKVMNQYGALDNTWNTIEDLTTLYRMSRDIQDGVRHIRAKLPSFMKTKKNQYLGMNFSIDIGYTEPGKAQLGIYLGNDNHVKISILLSDTGSDLFTTSSYLPTDVIIDENRLQALQTQLESRVPRSSGETTSLLQNFHSVIPVKGAVFPLNPFMDKVLLGGVYARYLACPTCQRCSVPYHFTSSSQEVELVAGLSSNDCNADDWKLFTTSSEVWSGLKRSDKGIRLSFTESQITEKVVLSQICYAVNDRERDTLLWNSFLAEICHFKSRFDAICPSSKSYTVQWYIELEVETTPGTWPVNELYLFVNNAIVSDYGNFQVPDIYWSQCPQGTTRLTTLELYPFGIHYLPKLTCEPDTITFNFERNSTELLQNFYESCGLNAFSDEVARAVGSILPRHFNLGDIKKRRRRSFTGHPSLREYPKENTFSIEDILPADSALDRNLGDYHTRKSCPLIFNSHLQNVLRLRQSNSCLGIRPSRYWTFLAAAEVLPESLRWYDLRTTGHEFAYGEVNINPRYVKLPSRTREFWSMSVRLGISVDGYLRRWEDYLASEDADPDLGTIFPESFDTDE
ncbi:hypothetical protein M422DRAFT_270337 [Sphaerobolus stellatus SS14]|uniref:Protein kinase domain-containing protein n=1 Tax=Sphaerobolus stellatus (strain SS14) TaxID=990650 RepID=A0A0C9UHM1_SPHS4|nr:hypothetical protein M422DRAFT_270337 [Sphaerobolus stellatus SS14]